MAKPKQPGVNLEALREFFKREYLKATGPSPMFPPVVPTNSGQDFQTHLKWLEDKTRAMYGIPESMLITTSPRQSGKTAAAIESGRASDIMASEIRAMGESFEAMTRAGPIKGKETTSAWVDEPLPLMKHDDMVDAMASTHLPATATQSGITAAVMEVPGVLTVNVSRDDATHTVHVQCAVDDMHHALTVKGEVEAVIERLRPVGVVVKVRAVSATAPPAYTNARCEMVETDEDQFMKRLRSKILERYPGGEE